MNHETKGQKPWGEGLRPDKPGHDRAGGPARYDRLNRRQLLALGAGMLLTGCSGRRMTRLDGSPVTTGAMPELDATAEGGIDLTIERTRVLIDGRLGSAITVNGSFPGPAIRMQEGEEAVIRVHNRLDESTSIHWHGILLPFTMDGVPGISFAGIAAGTTFTYRFRLRQNGTYWYHSHTGMQEQLGLYGMLIVSPKEADPVAYDREIPIVLSEWTFEDPHLVLRNLKTMEGYYNFQRQTVANIDEQMEALDQSLGEVLQQRLAWQRMRMDPTDIMDVTGATYRFLLNGQTAAENPLHRVRPGERVRLRFVNASAMTTYDVRIPGLSFQVVQADGQDVHPVQTEEFRIAVAETYDVVVTLPDTGAYTIFAETMDRSGYARATLSGGGAVSAPVPERRERPLLTMADMGMMHGAGHGGMDATPPAGHGQHHRPGQDGGPTAAAQHGRNHAPAGGDARTSGGSQTTSPELPVRDLPHRIGHGPIGHGPPSITMAASAYRRYDDPGPGLGDDGWPVLSYAQLRALRPPPDRRAPTRQFDLHLTGNMHQYIWGFDGRKWSESDVIRFQFGERLRINMINDTMMSHPIHLHGMWMDLYVNHPYGENPRKHTVNVLPAELLTVDITADAPGQWAFHCHLLYHMEMGMFRTVAVVRQLDGGPIDAD